MADEISITLNAKLEKSGLKELIQPGQLKFDQSGTGSHAPTATIGTSEETISFGDISTIGYCFMQNIDPTNYVTYGPDSSGMVSFGRIEAGEIAMFRLSPGMTLKAQANTAAVKVKFWFFED